MHDFIIRRHAGLAGALLVCAVFIAVPGARADYYDGLRAYDGGDIAAAVAEWRRSAAGDDALSPYRLGALYEAGEGVPQDFIAALEWYALAAIRGNGEAERAAQGLAGRMTGDQKAEALDRWITAVQSGRPEELHRLGEFYEKGVLVATDPVEAYRWYNLAGASGVEAARASRDALAKTMTPEQVARAQELSRDWRPPEPKEPAIPARTHFGKGFDALRSGEHDVAITAFIAGLKQEPDNGQALFFLAEAYRAKGLAAAAKETYRLSAERDPDGPKADEAGAQFRALSSGGLPPGVRASDQSLRQTDKIPLKDIQNALKAEGFYKGAVDGIHGPGTSRAITEYQKKVGAETSGTLSPLQMVALIAGAAARGDARSQTAFGVMLALGRGPERDDAGAVQWLERAVEQGLGLAKYNLGYILLNGRGPVAKDPARARVLLREAADGGSMAARRLLYQADGKTPPPPDAAQEGSASTWERTFGGDKNEWASAVVAAPDGGYLVTGRTASKGAGETDAWVLRLDEGGKLLGERTFGGKGHDTVEAISPAPDGGYLLAGYTQSAGEGDGPWVLRLDAGGRLLWDRVTGSGNDGVAAISSARGGGHVLAGSTKSASGSDVWILRLDAEGHRHWARTFGGKGWDTGNAVVAAPDGGYLVVGQTYSDSPANNDAWILRLDAEGGLLWERTFGREMYDHVYAAVAAPDGGYLVAGNTYSTGPGKADAWILRLDADGGLLWERTFGGEKDESVNAIVAAPDGGYVIAGSTKSTGAGGSDGWILRLDAEGAPLWERAFGGEKDDYVRAIVATPDGGYVLAGDTESAGAGESDVWVLRLDATGRLK